MMNGGCKADGSLNDTKFNEPMPWIGIYVAAGSLACGIAMAVDTFHGFRYKKFWFPCKFFSLNATTLTLIAIAIKFSLDLNAAMPHRQDQLAKVSSSAFICTVIANLMPSLGTMKNTELLTNIVALGILVVTSIANICIQMGTGVIFVFWIEHVFIMVLMLILLAIVCSLSLAIPSTKHHLDIKYSKKLQMTNIECANARSLSIAEKLRKDLVKYWMMAYTSSPQFVIGRSAPCTASGAFCLINCLILTEAILRSYFMPWSLVFCNGESDYKWSTTMVLISQTIAVGIGTISPVVRWFTAINFRCPKKAKVAYSKELGVEKYWIKMLLLWQVQPLDIKICSRRGRKVAHKAKYQIFGLFIGIQKGVVLSSKILRFVSIFVVGRFLKLKRLIGGNNSVSTSDLEEGLQDNRNMNLSRFVIHLEGEEELVDLMMENTCDATAHWIKMGEKQQPENLIKLLEKLNSSMVFTGVREFDSDKVPSLGFAEPPHCWALPVVTLTSIAISLPSIDLMLIKQLISGVDEGLKYVREIENYLDKKKNMKKIRKAEEIVWSGVELYGKWLDVDLSKIAVKGNGVRETIEALSCTSKKKFMEHGEKGLMHPNDWCLKETPTKWCISVLAANSMYRICETILCAPEIKQYECSQILFEKLSLMICSIFAASFTNLHHVISKRCHQSNIEEREKNIRYVVHLFGRTEKIIRILDMKKIRGSDSGELVHIDDWDLLCKQENLQHSISSPTREES